MSGERSICNKSQRILVRSFISACQISVACEIVRLVTSRVNVAVT
jgi:hypothetical protein